MRDVLLGVGAEFDAIRELRARWGPLAVNLGDDAAVLAVPRGDSLVASVDSAVEGRHFRRHWLSPREIGYRAVVAALSDLAAMAAAPLGVLVALTVPAEWRDELFAIGDGIGDAVRAAATVIRGGNLSDGGELSLTTTVLGAAFSPLTRTGAREGDFVYVTGQLGGPASAISELLRGAASSDLSPAVRERFARPVPRLKEARWLADRGVTAAIDVSDGLLADVGHLAAASGVSIDIDSARVPCIAGVDATVALHAGEEYELLVTSPAALDVEAFSSRFGLPLSVVGRVERAGLAGEVRVDGAHVATGRGYDHFSR